MASDATDRKWMIRDADGRLFGPATMETLVKWARDGRLAAEQTISPEDDGEKWEPVDSVEAFEMDWAAELAPGKFFGPVNRDAMREFIRSGDVPEDVAQFVRVKSIDESPEALRRENEELKARIGALRADFDARSSKLESELAAAESERLLAAGELSTRDMEFEAERQSFAAERSRMEAERQAIAAEKSKLKAELAKADKRAEVLAAHMAETEARSRSRESDLARISELENQVRESAKEIRMLRAELESQGADARRKLKEVEVGYLEERKDFEARLRSAREAMEGLAAVKKREEGVRRLLSQMNALLASDKADKAEIADAVLIDGK